MNRFELLPGSLQEQNGVFPFINTRGEYFSVQGRESTQQGVTVSPARPQANLHCRSAVLGRQGFEARRKCMELFQTNRQKGRALIVKTFSSNPQDKCPFWILCDFWAWNPRQTLLCVLHTLVLDTLRSVCAFWGFSQSTVALAALVHSVFLFQSFSYKIWHSI